MKSRPELNHELVNLASGVVGGALAGAVVTRVWRAVSDNVDGIPEAFALDRDIRDVLVVAALQGAVFGLIKAVFGRITAHGYRRFASHQLER